MNFNYAAAATAGTTVSPTTVLTLSSNQVGINNASPGYALDITGQCNTTTGYRVAGYNGYLLDNYFAANDRYGLYMNGGTTRLYTSGNFYAGTLAMSLATGAGTFTDFFTIAHAGAATFTNVIYAQGSDSVSTGSPYGYLGSGGAGTYSGGSTSQPTSISASYRVRATEFDAYSDSLIKKYITDRDGQTDLETLMKIRMRSFKHIDPKKSGDDETVGVIAQELEQIPELRSSVKHFPDYIPDTFEKRDCICSVRPAQGGLPAGGTINIVGTSVGKDGDEVQFYYIDVGGTEVSKTGVAFNDGYSLKIKDELSVNEIFVYGKKIDDFKSVAYNSLHNLNISATQELYKIIQKQNDRIDDLERKLEQITKYSYRAGVI